MKRPLSVRLEKKLSREKVFAVGCDEVGRGAVAGPIVAAAVCFDFLSFAVPPQLREVRDSKQLTGAQRESIAFHIKRFAMAWSIASVDAQSIDVINIHQANLKVCTMAVKKLHAQLHRPKEQTHVFMDGRFTLPDWSGAQTAVVKGDSKIFSIAAASILAKVYRDRFMAGQARRFPEYGFERHKGYGTEFHREVILKLGLTELHRKTFC